MKKTSGTQMSLWVVMALTWTCLSTGSTPLQAAESLTLAGSTTVQPIAQQAGKAFAKLHPDVKVVVGGGGSSHGVKAAAAGEVTIGMASRHLKPEEKTAYPDLQVHVLGNDGIAVIVNRANPVTQITKAQVQDIYTGRITNWNQLGGPDAPIELVGKEEGHSTLELFCHYFELEGKEVEQDGTRVMVHRKKGEEQFAAVGATLIGPNKQAIAKVSIKPYAIGYVSIGTAEAVARKGGRIKLLQLDGVEATSANVANGTYPLCRPLNLVTRGNASGVAQEFLDYLLGPSGQALVAQMDFIPVKDPVAVAQVSQ